MKRHHSKTLLAISIDNLAEREKAADKRPVVVDAASFRLEEHTASVGFEAKNLASFFDIDV